MWVSVRILLFLIYFLAANNIVRVLSNPVAGNETITGKFFNRYDNMKLNAWIVKVL